MKILRFKNNQLQMLGEGKIYSKKNLKLREGVDANISSANGIQDMKAKAAKVLNQNPNVDSASADAGHIDNQNDMNSGEGMKLQLPINANGKQLSQAQNMVKNQGNDDMQVSFTKPQVNGQTQGSTNESRIMEMRANAIPFTKKELNEFLNSL